MNKKGFTLIELLSVIILIGLILGIATTGILRGEKKAKEKTLASKVKNIEKAAIVYGQNHRENFVSFTSGYCEGISNCKYYEYVFNDENKNAITVSMLLENDDDNGPYINADDDNNNILNPTDNNKNMNACEIQIYQKYGKIYAVYDKNKVVEDEDTKCWK